MTVCQAEEGSKQSTTALQAVQQEADKQKQAVATAQAMCKKVRLSSPQALQHSNPCSFTCGFSRLLGSCCVLTVHHEGLCNPHLFDATAAVADMCLLTPNLPHFMYALCSSRFKHCKIYASCVAHRSILTL